MFITCLVDFCLVHLWLQCIEAWTKRLPFCRQHFQIGYCSMKTIVIWLKFNWRRLFPGFRLTKLILDRVMAWCHQATSHYLIIWSNADPDLWWWQCILEMLSAKCVPFYSGFMCYIMWLESTGVIISKHVGGHTIGVFIKISGGLTLDQISEAEHAQIPYQAARPLWSHSLYILCHMIPSAYLPIIT